MGNVEFANICERFSDDYRLRPLFSFRVEDNQSDFKSVCRSEKKPPSPPPQKKRSQDESGTRSEPSFFSIIAVETGNNKTRLENQRGCELLQNTFRYLCN